MSAIEYIYYCSSAAANAFIIATSIVAIIALIKNKISPRSFDFDFFLTKKDLTKTDENLIAITFDLTFKNFTDKSLSVIEVFLVHNNKRYEIFNGNTCIDTQIQHHNLLANIEIMPYQSITHSAMVIGDRTSFSGKKNIKLTAITTRKTISHSFIVDFYN